MHKCVSFLKGADYSHLQLTRWRLVVGDVYKAIWSWDRSAHYKLWWRISYILIRCIWFLYYKMILLTAVTWEKCLRSTNTPLWCWTCLHGAGRHKYLLCAFYLTLLNAVGLGDNMPDTMTLQVCAYFLLCFPESKTSLCMIDKHS